MFIKAALVFFTNCSALYKPKKLGNTEQDTYRAPFIGIMISRV